MTRRFVVYKIFLLKRNFQNKKNTDDVSLRVYPRHLSTELSAFTAGARCPRVDELPGRFRTFRGNNKRAK